MGKREKAATVDIGLRTKEALRARLEKAAHRSGRSMNAEIVERLEQSFSREAEASRLFDAFFGGADFFGLLKLVSSAMQEAGRSAGFYSAKSIEGSIGWMDNPYAYDQAVKACSRVLEAYRPKGKVEVPSDSEGVPLNDIGRGYANAVLAQMLGNQTQTQFFNQDRAAEVKEALGAAVVDRLSAESIAGEDALFTVHRDKDTQVVARARMSGKKGNQQ
jgi:Arc-like DNA binding dprotein